MKRERKISVETSLQTRFVVKLNPDAYSRSFIAVAPKIFNRQKQILIEEVPSLPRVNRNYA